VQPEALTGPAKVSYTSQNIYIRLLAYQQALSGLKLGFMRVA